MRTYNQAQTYTLTKQLDTHAQKHVDIQAQINKDTNAQTKINIHAQI